MFKELKSKCKTAAQRKAFNALVRSFAKKNIPTIGEYLEFYLEDRGHYNDPEELEDMLIEVKGEIGKPTGLYRRDACVLLYNADDENSILDDSDKLDEILGDAKPKTIYKNKDLELQIDWYKTSKYGHIICLQPDFHQNGAESYFISTEYAKKVK